MISGCGIDGRKGKVGGRAELSLRRQATYPCGHEVYLLLIVTSLAQSTVCTLSHLAPESNYAQVPSSTVNGQRSPTNPLLNSAYTQKTVLLRPSAGQRHHDHSKRKRRVSTNFQTLVEQKIIPYVRPSIHPSPTRPERQISLYP
ncbi:hypothetical protein BP00DRAFT_50587 [Aspergillus indologenus CBS 114.80]|uniref:Uncharacterized protein n=1 Tax=Aspergillus indologenus CBS 114.80 TaxID=1450541 RepID=A0A2V5HSB7_9EURO|nr:hypothetical protein BP00DRAFT_50587 [Aspergillus indologenus CBS 114.80]